MRIWSLHPCLLDRRALVACWRETLLAQKVLRGLTRGYTNHPQLIRFRAHPLPLEAVAAYLSGLADEADARGYSFNRALIGAGENSTGKNSSGKNGTDKNCTGKAENPYASVARIPVPLGQLEYELAFLQHKVAGRDPEWEHRLNERLAARGELAACAHPLFEVVPGAIEPWEKTKDF
ncbi:MAG: pyrimidine dimer DNA glycosylase [Rothia sp.]|uniref:pyrimidine dimer DNA glycosylase/endonuclease V n=1 Tax=Rothia sp. (in: high G+C Gram-positive bacteria) TaxID=1885016 RepID=UPI001CB0D836|nr:pyrimidine dimer DNA glycosylase/endonuclease V [Rothia sp. (in: high G+C Gram-positive bacteria)]MBF1681106.1 pyrimidine dimer DNA glycosylase [Rothia sp. (in: high G+C Gram-positive bacteria)]